MNPPGGVTSSVAGHEDAADDAGARGWTTSSSDYGGFVSRGYTPLGDGSRSERSSRPGRWADPVAPRPATCPICTVERAHLRTTGCCKAAICGGCIESVVRAKAEAASELVARYLDKAHQCPQCGHGPVEHFACSDLQSSNHNQCANCSFRANNISAWPCWDGQLPAPELRPVDGHYDCPFCRKSSRLDRVLMSRRERMASQMADERPTWMAATPRR